MIVDTDASTTKMDGVITLLLLNILAIETGLAQVTPTPVYRPKCNGVEYDRNTHQCCGNELYALDSRCSLSCCGNQRYDEYKQMCSYGPGGPAVRERTYGERSGLCGSTVYNRDTHVCCQGNIVQRPAVVKDRATCCGKVAYDSATHICCRGAILKEKIGPYSFCCAFSPGEATVYDLSTQMCCNNKVVAKPSSGDATKNKYGCCGSSAYNVYTQACCQGQVVSADFPRVGKGQVSCCGAAAYNPEIHLCCRGKVREKKTFMSRCCGDQEYDYGNRTKTCCRGVLQTIHVAKGEEARCCGTEGYNPRTHICCENNYPNRYHVLSPTPGGIARCCGSKPYNSITHYCCRERNIVTEKKGYTTSCCEAPSGKTTAYEFAKQICCEGVTAERHGLFTRCCGKVAYDSSTKACCQNQVVDANFPRENGVGCCGAAAYSPDTHQCCNGKVSRKKGLALNRCCRDEAYDPTTQLCCNGVVNEMTNNRRSCCGKDVFDWHTHICCSGSLVLERLATYTGCCGNQVMNRETHMCCAMVGTILPKPRDDKGRINHCLRCCNTKTYDPKVLQCCNGEIQQTCPVGSTGNIWGSTGNVGGSTGNIWGSTGNVGGSTGNIWGSTGNVRGSTGNIWGGTGNVRRSTGNVHKST